MQQSEFSTTLFDVPTLMLFSLCPKHALELDLQSNIWL